MIKQKKHDHYLDSADMKLNEKLLLNDETKFYASYDLKRTQPPSA